MTILKEILTKPIKEEGMIGDDASKEILDKTEEEKTKAIIIKGAKS